MRIASRIAFVLLLTVGGVFAFIGVLRLLATRVGDVELPTTLREAAQLQQRLEALVETDFALLLFCYTAIYLLKQTFAVPGSFFLNILGGALFGTTLGTILATLLTAVGSSCAYGISFLALKPLMLHFFSDRIAKLRRILTSREKEDLLMYLIGIRLFPIMPHWFMNLAAPVLDIPISIFFTCVAIGALPYNFICAQAGSVLEDLADDEQESLTFTIVVPLALIAVAVFGLAALRKRFKARRQRDQTVLAPKGKHES